jgi:UDP-2,4-diacetamido-2,4,6-trideoxy-beta-L-altropyranose hydrolase
MNPGTLLIRTDASIAIGTGHVMRCLALAQAWQDAGGKVVFATAETTPTLEERLCGEGIDVVRIDAVAGTVGDSDRTSQLAARGGADWVVVDGYQFGAEYQSALKRSGCKTLFIDDNGHAAHYSADLVLNQNAYAVDALYRDRESGTELLLGLQYAMLRREFLRWRETRSRSRDAGFRTLVTLGGSDPENLTLRVVESLQLVKLATLEVTIVSGGSSPHFDDLEAAVATSRVQARLLRNVTNMPELMAWANVAISAAGTTVLELAFMGIPAILFTVADNQRANAKAWEDLGFAQNLGNLADAATEQLAEAVRGLIADPERRKRMADSARALVDGLGAKRVAARLAASRGGPNGKRKAN